jgi:hypothetical protein
VQQLDFTAFLSFFPEATREALSARLLEPESVGVVLYADDDPATAVPGFHHIGAVYATDEPGDEPLASRVDDNEELGPRRFTPVGYYAKPRLPAPAPA